MKSGFLMKATLIAATMGLAACANQPVRNALAFGPFNDAMDASDKERAVESVRANTTSTWRSARGNEFTVKPTRTYEMSGLQCRDYTITGTVAGKQSSFSGQGCRQPDGGYISGG